MTKYQELIAKAESLEQAALRARDAEIKIDYVKKARALREQALTMPISQLPTDESIEFLAGLVLVIVMSGIAIEAFARAVEVLL
jgi:hypothetical protein